MTEHTAAEGALASSARFMTGFLLLSIVSGVTIGMAKIITTLYAIDIGVTPRELGIILGMESLGMVLVTVPAGFIIARHGARQVYFLASLGPLLIHLVMPFAAAWGAIAVARGVIGLCIPFRVVSMNGAFLNELKKLGPAKAGWYRASLTLGMALLGPAVGYAAVKHIGFVPGFLIIAALFGLMAFYSRSFFPAGPIRQGEEERGVSLSFYVQLRALIKHRDIIEVCGIELLGSSAAALFTSFIILVARDLPGLSEGDGVTLILVQGGISVLALLSFGQLFRNLTQHQMYGLALLSAVVGLLSLGFGQTFWQLAAGAACLSAATALAHLVNMRQLSGHAGDKSHISGLYNLAQMLGAVTGAFTGAFLSDYMPVQTLFVVWLAPLFAASLILFISGRKALTDDAG